MKYFAQVLIISLLVVFTSQSYSLPAYIPLTKRANESQVILVAEVISSRSRTVNQTIDTAELQLTVKRILKKPESIQIAKKITLNFALYPNSYESKLRATLQPGTYFVFLNVETIKKEKPNLFIFRLYEPNPFAFADWNSKDELLLTDSL